MEEQNAIIEITDTEIRLVVGYVLNGKPHIIHVGTKTLKGLISHGEIVDSATLSEIISSLREVRDPNSKEKMVINEVTVILPALGLNIFEAETTTNVVSDDSIISKLDIENLVSQIQKEQVPVNSEIIDIIPDAFTLDGGKTSVAPPIGQRSNSISLKAKIHTLPSRIVREFSKAIQNAHLSVKKFCLNSYAAAELGKYTEGMPENYILVDMGAEVSDITLVGKHSPYGTIAFQAGGTSIVNRLVERFGVTPDVGLKLLTDYGYCTRKLSFKPVLIRNIMDGAEHEFTQDDLNAIIYEYFQTEFFPHFDAAFSALLNEYQDQVKQLPLVFIGGFSMMIGFKQLAEEKFVKNQSLHFLAPNVIGARTAQFSTSVGGLLVAASNKGALSEQRKKFKGLTR